MGGTANAYGWGDFFRAGVLDLITSNLRYDNNGTWSQVGDPRFMSDIVIWRRTAGGRWYKLWTAKGCLHPRKILTADFNNDTYADAFIACTGWDGTIPAGGWVGEVSMLVLSNGKGGFSVKPIGEKNYLHGASASDVNGDGFVDIIVADVTRGWNGKCLYVLMNQGNGVFVIDDTRFTSALSFSNYFSLESFDVDGDGINDILAGSERQPTHILYGDRSGRYGVARRDTIAAVRDRGTVLDFTLVTNGAERGIVVGRTADFKSGHYYDAVTLQYVQLPSLASRVVLDDLSTRSCTGGCGYWVAWWMPSTQGGRSGVVPYATKASNGIPISTFVTVP